MSGQVIEGDFCKNARLMQATKIYMDGWRRVVYAHECELCDMCAEPFCDICEEHYAECDCPGPHQDDEYEYKTINGIEHARRLKDGSNN